MATNFPISFSGLNGWLMLYNQGVFKTKKERKWFVLNTDRRALNIYKDSGVKKGSKSITVHMLGAHVEQSDENPLKIVIQLDKTKTVIKANTEEECTRWLKALRYCTTIPQPQEQQNEELVYSRQELGNDSTDGTINTIHQEQQNEEDVDSRPERVKDSPNDIINTIGNEASNHANVATSTTSGSFLCVCAIDFGTTFSTWAYSLISDYNQDPTKCYVKPWNAGGSVGLLSDKCPTVVLIKPDGKTILAFGYEAENKYVDLVIDNNAEEYYYFRRFKMALNKKLGESLDRETRIDDISGKQLRAIDVVAMTIKYLKDDMMEDMNKRLHKAIKAREIKWILTVPAIWTDGAKQFMREAGIQAGIESDRLELALEPEAASIFCRRVTLDGAGISGLPIGARYLVLDAGGGTMDVTVHEVTGDGCLKEVHAACGGPWGGTCVDKAFEAYLRNLLGDAVVKEFQENNLDDWIELWRSFEIKKREFKVQGRDFLVRFPSSLSQTFEEVHGRDLSSLGTETRHSSVKIKGRDKLLFSVQIFKDFFNESITETVELLRKIKQEQPAINTILMVGGFSESQLLQDAVRSAFNDLKIIIPAGASTAVVRGAVIWGHMPNVISQRVLKYTYGSDILKIIYIGDTKHKNCQKLKEGGKTYCNNSFQRFVEKGQAVKLGEKFTKTCYPIRRGQQSFGINVYATEVADPIHISESDCKYLGILTAVLREPVKDPDSVEILVNFTFSGTELIVDAEERGSHEKVSVTLNCLGD